VEGGDVDAKPRSIAIGYDGAGDADSGFDVIGERVEFYYDAGLLVCREFDHNATV
jgi:hypothetical protein